VRNHELTHLVGRLQEEGKDCAALLQRQSRQCEVCYQRDHVQLTKFGPWEKISTRGKVLGMFFPNSFEKDEQFSQKNLAIWTRELQ
jgi:hypothetical protein